ncbi:MAG: hypoxanthine phosphoribosyltransferase, partial [Acidimicrobiales bacterium]
HPSTVAPGAERFAHPSEGLFASLLSLYGLEWTYEPVEFALAWNEQGEPTRGFRPDFYVESMDLFIELTVLTQRLVTKKNQKIRAFRALYPDVDLVVVYQRDFAALIERHALGDLTSFAA